MFVGMRDPSGLRTAKGEYSCESTRVAAPDWLVCRARDGDRCTLLEPWNCFGGGMDAEPGCAPRAGGGLPGVFDKPICAPGTAHADMGPVTSGGAKFTEAPPPGPKT